MALTKAEALIRKAVSDGVIQKKPKASVAEDVKKIVKDAVKMIRIPALRLAAIRSLNDFFREQWSTAERMMAPKRDVLLGLLALAGEKPKEMRGGHLREVTRVNAFEGLRARGITVEDDGHEAKVYGVPVGRYSEEYWEQQVRPVYDRLLRQFPKDPDDISGRNSLRNRAEMEVRYNAHQDEILRLTQEGHKLVISSEHANCSERCRPWQNRVFSLDGTSGVTDDGRKYVPLEVATESRAVQYTTKAGVTYNNGLLGFNCRHYLVPYKSGFRFPKPSAEVEKKEYALDQRQRALERRVRRAKTKLMVMEANTPQKVRDRAKKVAKRALSDYRKFCDENERTYYPSRITI